jgi:DNA helicase II / ATP-dependent DNA helicase PcrA
VYANYQERLERAHAVDFADLIRLPVKLFQEHPTILQRYQQRFRYVMVDEYQDTNHTQYQLMKLLTQAHDNLCCVGDVDQSIYGWRGADIRNILSFETDYPQCMIIQLEQNYRSTQTILNASNAVIQNNESRRPKNLWTDNKVGEQVVMAVHPTDLDEAGWVARKIYSARQAGLRYQDMAIFYRTNAQSRVFEESMRRAGIPYVIFGGIRFYERREVKDMLAYLRLLVNPHDGVGLTRVMNVPPRGIGKTTIDRLIDRAAQEGTSIFDVLGHIDECAEHQHGTRKKLRDFRDMLLKAQDAVETLSMADLWERLVDLSGYVRWLMNVPGDDTADRVANVEELGRAVAEAPYDPTAEGSALQQFLDQVALVSDIDRLDGDGGAVCFMTLHLAKGLEFPHVFMVGMEEGLFPHSRSLDDDEGIEEERRLCYVGMTRAQEQLYVTYAQRRRLHGREQYNIPSRFLDEIPAEHVEHEGYRQPAMAASRPSVPTRAYQAPAYVPTDDNADFDVDQRSLEEQLGALRTGCRVAHPMFGPCTIRQTDGAGERMKVIVQFDRVGTKTLMVAYANLNVLG